MPAEPIPRLPLVRPFAALRPAPARAAEVIAPPYDVVSDEARARAAGKPWSFLHVSRPEIDLPAGTDPYSAAVYAQGAENLARMLRGGRARARREPSYYVYRFTLEGRVQTGVAVVASVAAYDANRVRKHELTRPDKENDRVRNIETLNAQTGPVLLGVSAGRGARRALAEIARGAPETDVTGPTTTCATRSGRSRDAGSIARIGALFDAMPALYIADGHHRSAAASASRRGGASGAPTPTRATSGSSPWRFRTTSCGSSTTTASCATSAG